MKSQARKRLSHFMIITILVAQGLLGFGPHSNQAQAQDRAIIIKAEQPNVRTLEQAHYLLAQMHRRSLDLKAKSLDELDANEISGLRFDILKTLIELGLEFNQADLVSNRMLSRQRDLNSQRRQTLLNDRDKLRTESLSLTREIAALEGEKAHVEQGRCLGSRRFQERESARQDRARGQ